MRVALKGLCSSIIHAEFSGAFGSFGGMSQGLPATRQNIGESSALPYDSCDLALGCWQAQLQILEK